MIQSLLFFCLGFLSAALLALLIAPAFRRRAVRLTERRIRATVPLTMNEIQAEKDGLRAEFAMSTRRLEMKVKDLREKIAGQMVEIGRGRQELEQAAEERDRLKEEAATFDAKKEELEAALERSGEEVRALAAKVDEMRALASGKDAEIARLDLAATDASLEVSNRQIELAAREAEAAKLQDDLALLEEQRRENERKLREAALEHRSEGEALKAERARAAELERRLEKALAASADRDETHGSREGEFARPRESRPTPPAEAPAANGGTPAGAPATQEEALARLAAERKRLEERLTTLTRENKRLRTVSLPPPERPPARMNEPEAGAGEAALREEISKLAAEMVALTALIEGPDSPIDKMLATPEAERPGGAPSLADRVRALREAARRE